MSKQSNLKKNVLLQTIYEVLATCLPLITSPYLSRVLGVEKLGVYSFTSSIVAYFILFSRLGTLNHGVRSIAAVGDDQNKCSEVFEAIFTLQTISTSVCICCYAAYLFFFCKDNHLIACIQIIDVFANLLCVSWLFAGLERFEITVKVSIFIKLLTVGSILLFVKNPTHLWRYALIMSLSTFLTQFLLWFNIKGILDHFRFSLKGIGMHLKSSIVLFIPLLAMSFYHIMDKTMLGSISNYEQSGLYYNADKIVNITVGIISGISTVMLPRMSSLIGGGNREDADNLFKLSLEGTSAIGIAMAFGIAAISKEFIPVFFGSGFDGCIPLTIALSPVLIIKSLSFTLRYQYLIPYKKEKSFMGSVIAGAIVNLIVNFALIPVYGAMGAVIGTLLAESTACIWQYTAVARFIDLEPPLKRLCIYFIIGILMLLSVRTISSININIFFKIIAEVICGVIVYSLLCLIYWKSSKNPIYKIILSSIKAKTRFQKQ